MTYRIIFGLLGAAVLYGLFTLVSFEHVPSEQVQSFDSANNVNDSVSASREIMIDPESGEMTNDPKMIEKIKKESKTPAASAKKKKVKMTEMEGGALKVELGKDWIRSHEVSIDNQGDLSTEGHSQLQVKEAQ